MRNYVNFKIYTLAIAEKEIKLLWGRAAGICSNPECRKKLSDVEDTDRPFIFGEMAHVVARALGGPRATEVAGADVYNNLILLCPTCHTMVDKQPDAFPKDLLTGWKADHEHWVDSNLSELKAISLPEMATKVLRLLAENYYYFEKYGPKSDIAKSNPESNAFALWMERRLDTIVPNNRTIVSMISGFSDEMDENGLRVSMAFKDHALSYEKHIYDRLESYSLFPSNFKEYIESISDERK